MERKNIIKGVFYLILIVLTISAIVYIIKTYPNKNSDIVNNVQDTTETMLIEPSNNMKNTYYIDFDVYYSASAKRVHVIHDRISPIIKLKMGTGQLIIEYLDSSPNNRYVYNTREKKLTNVTEYFTNEGLIEDFTHGVLDNNDDTNEKDENPSSCICPPPGSVADSDTGTGGDFLDTAKVMKIVTPSVSFQRNNKIEIRQNLRMIDVYLNKELIHTELLEHVPYLHPGKGLLLPNDAGKYIRINKFSFKNKLEE
tara:strand:- start:1500 stop:2261 length:762 start_codon:yes stop_codon:yes gene_type:complete